MIRRQTWTWTIAIAAVACAPLDRTGPFRSPAYVRAVEAAERAAVHANRGEGPYEAGWARAEIKAPAGVPLAGYGARHGEPSLGVRDPTYARAFAIRAGGATVVLFAADLLLVTPDLAAAIRTRLANAIAPDRIFFTASHTHSGPGGFAHGFLYGLVFGAHDPRAFEAIAAAHVEAAHRALAGLAPARIGSAEVEVLGVERNRVEKDGPVDPDLFALVFEKDDGTQALFWSFGCHPVTLSAGNRMLSADYPGVVARALEDRVFEVVAFAAGGVGSTNPRFSRPDPPTWLTDPLMHAIEAASARARASAHREGSLASSAIEVPLPDPRYRIATNVMLWPILPKMILDTGSAPFGAIAIGRTVLLHFPAELSGELARSVRRQARKLGQQVAVLPFNGKWLGYLVSRRTYDLDAVRGAELFDYETRTMSFFGPHEADLFLNLGLRLAAGVARAY